MSAPEAMASEAAVWRSSFDGLRELGRLRMGQGAAGSITRGRLILSALPYAEVSFRCCLP